MPLLRCGHGPELRGKPVVIGADPKQGKGRGVVATCSYEARAFGIRSAMPISQAFVLCPHAVFLPPDFPRYVKASADVMAILKAYGFPLQQVSIDEAFLDVSRLGTFPAATDLAVRIKDDYPHAPRTDLFDRYCTDKSGGKDRF